MPGINLKKLKIGLWNVKSIHEDGKIYNVLKEMQILNLNIMGQSGIVIVTLM